MQDRPMDFNVRVRKTKMIWCQKSTFKKLPPVEFDCGIKKYPQLSEKAI